MTHTFIAEQKSRLDAFLAAQLPHISRTRIQKDITRGCVVVAGELKTVPKYIVRAGDTVQYVPAEEEQQIAREDVPEVRVLFDAYDLLVIDKPAGLSVHPGAGVTGTSLADILRRQFPELEGVGETHRPGIVHRLDKDTSGVMLVAKTQAMYEYLKDAFAERKVKKEYIALVAGVPAKQHGFVDVPIGRDARDFRKYTTKNPVEAKPSLTEYRILEVLPLNPNPLALSPAVIDKTALISVNLHTGRTHQIRVHMASIGHPLLGDALYGTKKSILSSLSRQFLHARRIEVQLPDGTWIEAESGLPSDLQLILRSLDSRLVDQLSN